MPEYLRVLVVILVLATSVFAFTHQFSNVFTEKENFTRRRNIWFALTISAFLVQSFWIYLTIAVVLFVSTIRREPNLVALYFLILFVLPMALVPIPGMGLINYLFNLSHTRVLALFILLPAYFSLRVKNGFVTFGSTWPDKALIGYLLLSAVLYMRQDSLTNSLRQSFNLIIDVLIPYFVISRSLRDLKAFRDALLSLTLAIMILAPIAVFEAIRGWLLYQPLLDALDLGQGMTRYLGRDGMLRAIASAGQPIALGYLMVIGVGCYLFLKHSIQNAIVRSIGMLLLVAGLIAPLSRGPWVGAAVLFVVFIATGRYAVHRLVGMITATIVALSLISSLPGGERIINLLPYIGTTEKNNVEYREQLITNSMIVIERNPWLGSTDFLETPEMEAMRQGEGIIDVVNTYISVALESGLVGLGFFVAIFVLTLGGIFRAMRSISDKDSEEYLLGRVLLATLFSVMVMIFTVSSISIIPIMYWSIAGLGVAYIQMIRKSSYSVPTDC